jgi:hypothetical protein
MISRMVNGIAYQPLLVQLVTRCPSGIGLRCLIGLEAGVNYQLRIGTNAVETVPLRITSSRSRHDGTYDIGAHELPEAGMPQSVAA